MQASELESRILQVHDQVDEAIRRLMDARLKSIQAQAEWDEYFLTGQAAGNFDGRNESARMGQAIDGAPDMWKDLQDAKRTEVETDYFYKLARNEEKRISRMLALYTRVMSDNNEDTDALQGIEA